MKIRGESLLSFVETYEDKIHLIFAIFWIIMVVPTLLFWANSVAVVLIYSVYALVGAHIAAYEGAKDDAQIDLLIKEVRELKSLLEHRDK
jgi:hypothetical protein